MSNRELDRRLDRSYSGYISSSLTGCCIHPTIAGRCGARFVSLEKLKLFEASIKPHTRGALQKYSKSNDTFPLVALASSGSGSGSVGLRLCRSAAWQMAFSGTHFVDVGILSMAFFLCLLIHSHGRMAGHCEATSNFDVTA